MLGGSWWTRVSRDSDLVRSELGAKLTGLIWASDRMHHSLLLTRFVFRSCYDYAMQELHLLAKSAHLLDARRTAIKGAFNLASLPDRVGPTKSLCANCHQAHQTVYNDWRGPLCPAGCAITGDPGSLSRKPQAQWSAHLEFNRHVAQLCSLSVWQRVLLRWKIVEHANSW